MGVLYLVDQENKVDRSLLVKGEWESRQIAYFQQLVEQYRPGDLESVFLDIGAHGGLYSIIMKKCGLFERIIAFEPDSLNRAQLYANLFINKLVDKILVIPAAATNRTGTVGFVYCRGRHRGLSHVVPEAESMKDAIVDAVKIDDIVTQSRIFVAAKIDVEGFEADVLEGMQNAIRSNACVLQIEIQKNFEAIKEITDSYGLELAGQIGPDHFFVKA